MEFRPSSAGLAETVKASAKRGFTVKGPAPFSGKKRNAKESKIYEFYFL